MSLSKEEEGQLITKAAIGRQLVDFSQTKAYLALVDDAHQMKASALDALATVNPTDWAKIAEHQRDAAIADKFMEWIEQRISEGEEAEKRLTDPDAGNG